MTFPWIVAGVASITTLALGWVLARAAARKAPEPPGRPAHLRVLPPPQAVKGAAPGSGPVPASPPPVRRVFIAPVGADPRIPEGWRELGVTSDDLLDVDRMHDDWNRPW